MAATSPRHAKYFVARGSDTVGPVVGISDDTESPSLRATGSRRAAKRRGRSGDASSRRMEGEVGGEGSMPGVAADTRGTGLPGAASTAAGAAGVACSAGDAPRVVGTALGEGTAGAAAALPHAGEPLPCTVGLCCSSAGSGAGDCDCRGVV